MTTPTLRERIEAEAERYALGRDPAPTLDEELTRPVAEHTQFTLAEARAFRNGCFWLLSELSRDEGDDRAAAIQWVERVCPHLVGSMAIEVSDAYLGYRSGVRHARAQCADDARKHRADFAELATKAGRLVEALEKISDPRKRDHKEPDTYTELGCVMNIASEALAEWRRGE